MWWDVFSSLWNQLREVRRAFKGGTSLFSAHPISSIESITVSLHLGGILEKANSRPTK